MRFISKVRVWTASLLFVFLLVPLKELSAQQDKVAAFKQSLGENQKRLAQYYWVETTIISVKAKKNPAFQKRCFYGPDGKVQKQEISASPQQETPGGLRGKIAKKKKGEISDYMKQAVALVHQYVPPNPQRIQAVKDAGTLSMSPTGPGTVLLDFRDYLKPGDNLSLNLDAKSNAIQKINVNSYLDSKKDVVTLDVSFNVLSNGINYPAKIVLVAPEKKVQVEVQNSDYQMIGAAH